MKVALAAPRLSASIPTLPVPAKRSRNLASSTRGERISKRAVFTRSIIGRVPAVLGPLSLRPLASPVTTRIRLLLVDQVQHVLYFIQEEILFCPGNQRLYLVNLQFLDACCTPRALYNALQLLIADLRVQDVLQYHQAPWTGNRCPTHLFQLIQLDPRNRRLLLAFHSLFLFYLFHLFILLVKFEHLWRFTYHLISDGDDRDMRWAG